MKRFLTAGALIVAGVALAGATVGPAMAADLPPAVAPRAPAMYVPTVAPVYNWGGFYYGVQGGYGFGKSEWTVPGATTGNFNTSGFVVGPTIGANFQSDAFVFGVEADADATGIEGSTGSCMPVSCETKNTWLGTARVRAGYAADRVLFYGTAGGAFGNIDANTVNSNYQKSTKGGWTAGAGVEAAFTDNWTARIEYLFVDLENASFTTTAAVPATVKFDANLIRFGLDYKFR